MSVLAIGSTTVADPAPVPAPPLESRATAVPVPAPPLESRATAGSTQLQLARRARPLSAPLSPSPAVVDKAPAAEDTTMSLVAAAPRVASQHWRRAAATNRKPSALRGAFEYAATKMGAGAAPVSSSRSQTCLPQAVPPPTTSKATADTTLANNGSAAVPVALPPVPGALGTAAHAMGLRGRQPFGVRSLNATERWQASHATVSKMRRAAAAGL